jgi:hypothetical protein
MLVKGPGILRYYIINTNCLDNIFFSRDRSRILYTRPSRWKVFLQGALRLNEDLAFVRLLDILVNVQILSRKLSILYFPKILGMEMVIFHMG